MRGRWDSVSTENCGGFKLYQSIISWDFPALSVLPHVSLTQTAPPSSSCTRCLSIVTLSCSKAVMGCSASLLCPLLPSPTPCSVTAARVPSAAHCLLPPFAKDQPSVQLPRVSASCCSIAHVEHKFPYVIAAVERWGSRDVHAVIQELAYFLGILFSAMQFELDSSLCSKFSQWEERS